jgi:TrkA domain protein
MEVFETPLPGLGVRYEFVTARGDRLGVVAHRDGRCDLIMFDNRDPDACLGSIELNRSELVTLIELLGGTKITERLSDLRHEVEGLSIEWVTMPDTGGLTGATIGDGRIRTETGASVVAVIRNDASIPGPGPDFCFEAGDVVLVMGSAAGVARAAARLTG